ncbi:cupin domain-containing protein [Bradyrhizobium stylosanthis]|nr:cupin domain-containing protein [Bradyrhizobium stylosanthis]
MVRIPASPELARGIVEEDAKTCHDAIARERDRRARTRRPWQQAPRRIVWSRFHEIDVCLFVFIKLGEISMKLAHLLSSIALVATVAMAPAALAQEAPKLKVIPLQKEPLTGQPDKEVISVIVEWPPGSGTGLHTHPGDEYTTVLEGEVVGRKEGSEAKTYTAGQSYHNEPGVVHEANNKASGTAKTFNVFVVEKGKPLSDPVKR